MQAADPPTQTFAAIDFETADFGRDSACAVAIVRVEDGRIVTRVSRLIRPPRDFFVFTYIHGITWNDVVSAPAFGDAWPELEDAVEGVAFLAAHNASFDQSVLERCCGSAGIEPPRHPFRCTMQMARSIWSIYPSKLPDVCGRLGIPLNHHDPMSDAEACARIVIAGTKCANCPDARRCVPAEQQSCSRTWLA